MGALPAYLERILAAEEAAPAACLNGSILTYSELQDQSARLAGALNRAGLGQGSRIGIALDRNLDLPIALLGTLRAGACYIPLDLGYPRERLRMMLDIARPDLIIGAAGDPRLAALQVSTRTVAELVSDGDGAMATDTRQPDDLTYIIFTSGSTGRPKAVALPDRSLANLLAWQSTQSGFAGAARVLQFTPVSFDVHFQEFFHTWSEGGRLVLTDDSVRRDPHAMLALIQAERIERLYMPYIALSQLAEAATSTGFYPDSLRDIVTAGEQLVVNRAVRTFFEHLPGCRLHNQYGPSETHVVTAHTLSGTPADWPRLPPIGTPVADCWVQLVDTELRPVPVGATGELILGGACLAQGYYADQTQTAERFIDTPWGRGYRTGDLGCADDQGVIDYLGRADGQVKIRGHRIEPGEVEVAILNDDAISDCAVVPRGDTADARQLVAYLVLDAKSEADRAVQRGETEQWQQIWDGTYSLEDNADDPRFDLRGWNSSYTGAPLPAAEMATWVAGTAERILEHTPRRILELGCGTGLILHSLRGQFDFYHATDYSAITIDQLNARLQAMPDLAGRVQASRLAAHQTDQLHSGPYDMVVINSLTQHFVSVAYLVDVIRQAARVVRSGGQLFLGDITARNTRSLYFTSVEYARAPESADVESILDEAAKAAGQERELVFDPWFFQQLAAQLEEISDVRIRLKPGDYRNELSQFRFDVTLTVRGDARASLFDQKTVIEDGSRIQHLDQLLERVAAHREGTDRSAALVVQNIPNARVAALTQLRLALEQNPGLSIPEFRAMFEQSRIVPPAIDPNDLTVALAPLTDGRYQTWFSDSGNGFDLVIEPANPLAESVRNPLALAHQHRPLESYASRPLNQALFAAVSQRLRTRLGEQLPEYMMPARFVALAGLPKTASGKIDRRRLPAPSTSRPDLAEPYVAPADPLASSLCELWQSELDLDAVGINDNFFDLGGNSILSLKVAARMSDLFEQPVPVVALFQYPTIAQLIAHFGQEPDHDRAASQKTERTQRARGQQAAFAAAQRRRRSTRA